MGRKGDTVIKSKIRAIVLCIFLALIITSCGRVQGHREVRASAGQNQPAAGNTEPQALQQPLLRGEDRQYL
jgi:hypothetical protein